MAQHKQWKPDRRKMPGTSWQRRIVKDDELNKSAVTEFSPQENYRIVSDSLISRVLEVFPEGDPQIRSVLQPGAAYPECIVTFHHDPHGDKKDLKTLQDALEKVFTGLAAVRPKYARPESPDAGFYVKGNAARLVCDIRHNETAYASRIGTPQK